MVRTHVILDGLSDPRIAQSLSASWAAVGYFNQVDPAGQCATLWREEGPLDEAAVDRAAAIARLYGLELRDRAGSTFEPENDLSALRARVSYEWKSRFATALVFGLPALLLHYLSPVLVGADTGPRGMFYPWLFQILLVGWMCLAAGWPILCQGTLAIRNLRATGDLLTSVVVCAAFVPSLVAWVSVMAQGTAARGEVYFHAAAYAMILATFQRWLAHRAAERLRGRASWMIHGVGRLIGAWLLAIVIAGAMGGWSWALTIGLLMPPLMGLGAMNPWNPGPAMALPVLAFAAAMVFGSPGEHRIEIAAGFEAIMVGAMGMGWCAVRPA